MTTLTRVVVDAMGSDRCPEPEVVGALRCVRENARIHVTLVGDRVRLSEASHERSERIVIVHAPDAVTMDDHAANVFRSKPASSMRAAIELLKRGEADAVVSAGNSGAMLVASTFLLGREPGIERAAIIATIPTRNGHVVLCDAGANVEPRPSMLAQFGAMGARYAQRYLGIARPRVGLLSNGSEPSKGTELTRAAYAILEGATNFEFVGYLEGNDLFAGAADVICTDGFTGNVVLKTCEGIVGSSYAEIGGALLAGVTRPVVIAHGHSDERAICNAIRSAARFAT